MRLSDTVSGILLLIFGAAVAIHARAFPVAAGHGVGAGFFPIVIAVGLALGGVALIGSGRKQRDVRWVTLEDWVRRPRMGLNAALVIGALIGYALVVDTVGFFLTAFVFLGMLLLAFGVRKRWVAPIAAVTTLGMHFAFYTLLHVQLPWGWLEGVAW
jgi:putative tricarboxylic transport membrane protein